MALPNRIGSLLFCEFCGDLLPLPGSQDWVACQTCRAKTAATAYENHVITTYSHPAAFPSELRQKKSLVQPITSSTADSGVSKAKIRETCPKCKAEEVLFYTMQLRSADEGSTVFYECPNCGENWRLNN